MERGGSLILGCGRGEQEDKRGENLVKRKKGDGFRRISNSEGEIGIERGLDHQRGPGDIRGGCQGRPLKTRLVNVGSL